MYYLCCSYIFQSVGSAICSVKFGIGLLDLVPVNYSQSYASLHSPPPLPVLPPKNFPLMVLGALRIQHCDFHSNQSLF